MIMRTNVVEQMFAKKCCRTNVGEQMSCYCNAYSNAVETVNFQEQLFLLSIRNPHQNKIKSITLVMDFILL